MGVEFKLNTSEIERLQKAMEEYLGNVEEVINSVLHGEGGTLIQDSIRNLIPVSGATWKGKKGAAKTSPSLKNINENLAVTTTTAKDYSYLYFPDDGTTTRRHVGDQQFFAKGGEAVQDDIIDRCIFKLTNIFE